MITLGFSPDGQIIAGSGNDWDLGISQIQLYDLKAHRRIANIIEAEESPVRKIVFSPDAKTLVVVGSIIGLRDRKGVLRHRLTLGGEGNSLAFSPDGKYLVAGYRNDKEQGFIKIWFAHSRKLVLKRNLNSGAINDLAFSPDGSLLASACKNGEVQLWRFQEPLDGRAIAPR